MASSPFPRRYRKRPVVVEVLHIASYLDLPAMAAWVNQNGGSATFGQEREGPAYGTIETLEGPMRVDVMDYVIRGVAGEFYPCKPEIFAQTYDPWDDFEPPRGLTVDDLAETFSTIKNAPAPPPAPHHPKCDLVHGRGFCNCPTAEFERQVRGA